MRRAALRVLAFALALLLGMAASPVLAAPDGAHDGGSITGIVVNGSHAQAAVAGVPLTLVLTEADGSHTVGTASSDAQGRFSLTGYPFDPNGAYAIAGTFQGGHYHSPTFALDGSGSGAALLTVYDATTSDSALSVSLQTTLFDHPQPVNGLVRVAQSFTVHNAGSQAFVGSADVAAGQGPAKVLRFPLLSGAVNVQLADGFSDVQVIQIPNGLGAVATVPPGDTHYVFSYQARYSAVSLDAALKAEYPTARVTVLVASSIPAASTDMAAAGDITASGSQYHLFSGANVPRDGAAHVRLILPHAGEPPAVSFPVLAGVALLIAVLLALGVAVYLRRGTLAGVMPLIPTSRPEREKAGMRS
jgi:hypothetical protein